MSLYADTYTEVKEERLPTLRQYLKAKGTKTIPKQFLVTKIWVPNKYPSYSIETEHFRASVGKGTPLGELLLANWNELINSETPTHLSLQREKGKLTGMRFIPAKGNGMWMDIGDSPLLGISWRSA